MDADALPEIRELDERVALELTRWNAPGMAVGTLHEGALVTRGYGVTSIETSEPVSSDALFQIGSISKLFTATLVMRLVDEGLLDLQAPVVTYLPELRLADDAAQRTITLSHLLTHTSGLYGDDFTDFGMGDDALERTIAHYATLRQYSAPGALWAYCNTGFNIAGRVIEKVLKTPFETAMRERIFAPLQLKRAFYFAHEAIVFARAVGHSQQEAESGAHEIARHYPLPRGVNPAGGIISNVANLLAFAAFHMGDGSVDGTRVMRRERLEQMRVRQTAAANFAEGYGIGWAQRRIGDTVIVEHGGSTNGFQAQLTLAPERRFAVAMLTNSGRGAKVNEAIGAWALERYCGLRSEKPAIMRMSGEALGRFAGRYTWPDGEIRLEAHEGGLRREMRLKDSLTGKVSIHPPSRLEAIGEREFVVVSPGDAEGSRIDFIVDADGRPRFLRFGGRLADFQESEQ